MPDHHVRTAGQLLFHVAEQLGIRTVFGLPATQTVPLYDAVRTSHLRSVVTSHELAAAFAAIGHYRSSGVPAIVLTMPGPGLAYTFAGLGEARYDSAGLIVVVPGSSALQGPGQTGRNVLLEAARSIVKRVIRIDSVTKVQELMIQAFELATTGDPGPVVIEMAPEVVYAGATASDVIRRPIRNRIPTCAEIATLTTMIERAERPLLLFGQGAVASRNEASQLAQRLGAPIVTTSSGRGSVSEDDPLNLTFDPGVHGAGPLLEAFERADLIVAFGCKSAYASTGSFAGILPMEKLVLVDVSAEAEQVDGRARLLLRSDGPATIAEVLAWASSLPYRSKWNAGEIAVLRQKCREAMGAAVPAPPQGTGWTSASVEEFLRGLRSLLPPDACVVTDSGLHQMLSRAHFKVLAPRTLLCPTDFQSMGFALPAAIGASLACPTKRVVALLGDGGLTMSGLELLTAVRENLNLIAIVFNDAGFGLIRRRQLEGEGVSYCVDVAPPDLELLAASVGADYVRLSGLTSDRMRSVLSCNGVHVIELPVRLPLSTRVRRARNHLVESIRTRVGRGYITRVRRWFKGEGGFRS